MMGDTRRHARFADFIARQIRDRTAPVVDVAGGKGQLRAELNRRGFRDVTTWDKRHRNAKPRSGYHYGLFDYRSAPRGYGAVVAMHPDGGTDHAIMYAVKHRVPFVVCPCCVEPRATSYGGRDYEGWIEHLERTARQGRMRVWQTALPMKGRNIVLVGQPG